jgi:transposase
VFYELIAEYAEDPAQVVIGIETDRGLWVDALTAAGYQVFAINPLAAARYRKTAYGRATESAIAQP